MKEKENIYIEIGELTSNYTTKEFSDLCLSINLSVAPVNSIKEVAQLEFIDQNMLKTTLPDGTEAKLSPASYNTEFLEQNNFSLTCSPRLGEQNELVYKQIGFTEKEIMQLINEKII